MTHNRLIFIIISVFLLNIIPYADLNAQCAGFMVDITSDPPPPHNLCPGETITLISTVTGGTGPYTYLWSNGETTPNIVITPPYSGNEFLAVSDANGCLAENSIHIKASVWTVEILYVPTTICPGDSLPLYAFPDFPAGTTFLWSTGETTSSIFVSTSGPYSLTATDPTGSCTASVTENIELFYFPAPAPIITGPTVLCPGQSGTLEITNAASYTGFLWSNGETTSSIDINTPGTYAVTVTTDFGCTATGSVTVNSGNPPINITGITTPVTSCSSPNGAIDITPLPAGNYTYLWSNGASTQDLSGIPAGAYIVTVSGGGSCSATASFTVANNTPSPTPATTVTPSTCGLSNGAIDLSVAPPGTYSFTWSNGANTEDLSGIPAGAYSVTVTSAATGCTATASAVVANNNPPINITGITTPVTSCAAPNGAIDITPSPAGNYTYLWSNGASTQDLSGIPAGAYIVTVSGGGSCSATASFTIANNTPSPTASTTVTPSTCGLSNGAIDLSVAPPGTYSFTWSNGANTEDLSAIPAGTYSVTITSAANGCTSTASVEVQSSGANFTLSAVLVPNSSCTTPNGMINLSVAPAGVFSYLWSNGATTKDISGISAGNYAVTATDISGCSATASYIITDDTTSPQIQLSLYPPLCDGTAGWAEINPMPGSTMPIAYSINNDTSFITSNTIEGLNPGQYLLIIRDGNGCTVSNSISIPNLNEPQVFIDPEVTLVFGEQYHLHVSISGIGIDQIDTVIWTPTLGLTFDDTSIIQLLNPIAQPAESIVYTVTVVSKDGCEASAEVNFKVSRDFQVYAPNVIRPEDPDGRNSTFYIFTKPGTVREIKSLQIYDRWGNLVFLNQHFEPDNPQFGWNGDFRGQPMSPAVFVWWAELELFDGGLLIVKGDITVVR